MRVRFIFLSVKSLFVLKGYCHYTRECIVGCLLCVNNPCMWLLLHSPSQLFFNNDTVELVYAGAGALLFCAFIIYDTHLLMHQLSPEEHVLASINLYLDIVNLFLHILRILDSMKKHWASTGASGCSRRGVWHSIFVRVIYFSFEPFNWGLGLEMGTLLFVVSLVIVCDIIMLLLCPSLIDGDLNPHELQSQGRLTHFVPISKEL